jgi:hypothetical protein
MFKLLLSLLALAGTASAQFVFSPAASVPVGSQPEGVVLSDLDGNGTVDMAATSDALDKVTIHFGNGDGTFAAPVVVLTGGGTSPHALVAGDLDGDLDTDLAVTLKNINQVRVLRNDGGSFVLAGTTAVGADPRDLAIGHLDANGVLDLVTSNRDGSSMTVLLNSGAGSFTATTTALGMEPRGVAIGRLDADADNDIAVSSNDARRVDLYLNTGAGTFAAGAQMSTGINLRPEGIIATDLDGDGDDDIATAGSGGGLNVAMVWVHNGVGGFTGPSNFATGGLDPSEIAAADFDLDGDTDLATVNTDSNTVSLLPNVGGASYGAATTVGVGTTPQSIAIGDLDGNGGTDIAVTNDVTGDASVLINGKGTAWTDIGFGLAGVSGIPSLVGTGTLAVGTRASVDLTNAAPSSTAVLFLSLASNPSPFKGGTLATVPVFMSFTLGTDGTGSLPIPVPSWPPGMPSGFTFYVQYAIVDAAGPIGVSLSNAIRGIAP